MEKRWRALPKFVSIDFNDVDHIDDPSSNDAAISDADDDEKRWRTLMGLVIDDSNLLLFLILLMLIWYLYMSCENRSSIIKEFSKPCT